MTFIPDNKIDEIRERADIVQIVSEYVSLKKVGRNHKGLCPFHSEKTPSFTVSEDKQIFYCFGCHAGGNVFAFLMKHENMSFPETVKHLAKRYGIEIQTQKSKVKSQNYGTQKELMFAINQAACEFFIKNLSHDSKAAQNARDYLKKRGLTDEVIKEFKIGYAPNSWDSVLNFLRYKKLPLEIAEKTGLIIKKQTTSTSPKPQVSSPHYYDRFRNRLIFPIQDIQGRIIGFGGRTLGGDDAKYINSPESEIFKKGDVFYGIHQAKNTASKAGYALIVEGYFDLIALHQYGFKNSAATMGTALTESHLRKLKNYTDEVYALFDGDDAGRRAALRSIPLFLSEDIKARVVLVPKGIDPDDLLRKQGREPMERCIRDAEPYMDFLLNETKKRFVLSSSRGKISFIEEAGQYISQIKSAVEKNLYIEKTAQIADVGIDVVMSAVRQESTIKGEGTRIKPSGKEIISTRGQGAKIAEETILKVLMAHPDFYNEGVSEIIKIFRDDTLKEIGMLLVKSLNKDGRIDVSQLIDGVSDERIKDWLVKASLSDYEAIKEQPERILEDCKKIIASSIEGEEAKKLLKRLNEADRSMDRELFVSAAKAFIEKKRRPL